MLATIEQIALQLKLNKSTVSRALNNRTAGVSEETRRRIQSVAREMNYVPNPAARALSSTRATTRTGNIGLVSRKFNNALYTAIHLELAIAVDEQGGNLVSCITGRLDAHRGQAHLLHAGSVDGILAFPYALPALDEPDSPWMRAPLVFLQSHWTENRVPSVRFDDESGAKQTARHLWDLGHRRILCLQGLGPLNEASQIGEERLRFFRSAWESLGANADTAISVHAAQATAEGGREAMLNALAQGLDGATAVVAYSDQMAYGALNILQQRGLRVPEDLSLVGWNDIDETSAYLWPALTSVQTPTRAFALAAVKLLEQRIAEKADRDAPPSPFAEVKRVRVPVELIARASTGKAPGTRYP